MLSTMDPRQTVKPGQVFVAAPIKKTKQLDEDGVLWSVSFSYPEPADNDSERSHLHPITKQHLFSARSKREGTNSSRTGSNASFSVFFLILLDRHKKFGSRGTF